MATGPIDQPARDAPFHIGAATIAARDPARLADFYRGLGLSVIDDDPDRLTLGVGAVAMLRVVRATRPARQAAGLFHIAWALPSRAALGRWFAAMRAQDLAFDGASDHGVSEAFYLSDPEGNGVEVYADRAAAHWPRDAAGYAMTTARMDIAAVLAAGGGEDAAMPDGSMIGHVHLRAADMTAAERLYTEGFGMVATHRRPGAAWFGAGAYHHHLAVNAWSGALPPRAPGQPGLESLTLRPRDDAARGRLSAALTAAGGRDPSGVALLLAA